MRNIGLVILVIVIVQFLFNSIIVFGDEKENPLSPEEKRILEESLKDARQYSEKYTKEYREMSKQLELLEVERVSVEQSLQTAQRAKAGAEFEVKRIDEQLKLGPDQELERLRQRRVTNIQRYEAEIAGYRKSLNDLSRRISAQDQTMAAKLQRIKGMSQTKMALKNRLGLRRPSGGSGRSADAVSCFVLAIPDFHRANLEKQKKFLAEQIRELEKEKEILEKELTEVYNLYGGLTPEQRNKLLSPLEKTSYMKKFRKYQDIQRQLPQLILERDKLNERILAADESAKIMPAVEIINACLERLGLVN